MMGHVTGRGTDLAWPGGSMSASRGGSCSMRLRAPHDTLESSPAWRGILSSTPLVRLALSARRAVTMGRGRPGGRRSPGPGAPHDPSLSGTEPRPPSPSSPAAGDRFASPSDHDGHVSQPPPGPGPSRAAESLRTANPSYSRGSRRAPSAFSKHQSTRRGSRTAQSDCKMLSPTTKCLDSTHREPFGARPRPPRPRLSVTGMSPAGRGRRPGSVPRIRRRPVTRAPRRAHPLAEPAAGRGPRPRAPQATPRTERRRGRRRAATAAATAIRRLGGGSAA